MHSEVQAILDKDYPDRPATERMNFRSGERDRFIALTRMHTFAEDIGDEEMADDAIAVAKGLRDPETGEPFKGLLMKPYIHGLFHDGAEHNRIAIFYEKHGTYHYALGTAEETAKTFLSVLNERLTDDYWYLDELTEEEEEQNQLDLLKSNEPVLTDKQEAQKIIDFARSDERGALIRAGKAAFAFLDERSDYEYERMEIETLTVAEFS